MTDIAPNATNDSVASDSDIPARSGGKPSEVQLRWLARGLHQAGGKLPLFDDLGQRISERTVRACIERGWAEPWFHNPMKPDWLVCKLTETGRAVVEAEH